MVTHVRATYAHGVLTPAEPLNLEEGTEVTVAVQQPSVETAEGRAPEEQANDTGPMAEVMALVREMEEQMPAEERARSRADGAKNYRHYLYGHSKDEE